jgi:hypothetical protein
MADPVKTEQQQEQDDFGAAFADLAANLREPGSNTVDAAEKVAADAAAAAKTPEQIAAEKVATDAAAAAAAAKTPEQIAAEKVAADAAAAAKTPEQIAAEKVAADAAAAAAAAKTPEQIAAEKVAADAAAAAKTPEQIAAEKVVADLAEANRKIAELEAARTTATKTPEQIAAEQAAADQKKPLYTTDELAAVEKHRKEWEEVSNAEALIRRGEYHALVKHIFDQVATVYGPVLQYFEQRSPKDQYADLKGLVPDYDAVRDQAVAWAQGQPSFLKTAYNRVIEDGSPEEVRDMIDAFRKATGYKAPAASGAPVVAAVVAAPPDPKKLAAVTALKPVTTGRTESNSSAADPNDFDSAFKEFAVATK